MIHAVALLVLNGLMVASAAAVIVWCISTDEKHNKNWSQK